MCRLVVEVAWFLRHFENYVASVPTCTFADQLRTGALKPTALYGHRHGVERMPLKSATLKLALEQSVL